MIVIVAGMHRSGTSMLAGLLHGNGVSMGSTFRDALPENPNGFFEEEAFRQLNEQVLHRAFYFVEKWSVVYNALPPTVEEANAAMSLITRFDKRSNTWGWKDPRTCLTLTMWLSALEALELMSATRVIVIRRDMWAVARSLCARGNVQSLDHGAELWKMYNRQLDDCISTCTSRPLVLQVQYERILQGLDIEALELFCGRRLDSSFVDPSLNRSGFDDRAS
jgi:hypothetical protein